MVKINYLGLLLLAYGAIGVTSCGKSAISNETLVVGLECNYAPFNWTENTANEYTLEISNKAGQYADGYDIQIAKKLGELTGKEVTIVETAWEALIPDLTSGTINCVIAGMTDTEERRESIAFTNEYYRSELVLVAKADVAAKYEGMSVSAAFFQELASGKMFVSQVSTVTNDLIDVFVSDYGAVKNNPVDTFAIAALDVVSGAADFMTGELPVAESIVASNAGTLGLIHIDQTILGEGASELGVSIGIKKGNDELRSVLNEALAKISQEERNSLMKASILRSAY